MRLVRRAYAALCPRNRRFYYSKSYDFTSDWFTPRVPLWRRNLLSLRQRPDQALEALEVGTYEGRSALWLLENLLTCPQDRLVCVDGFLGMEEVYARFMENLRMSGAASKVEVLRNSSSAALPSLSQNRFSLIYLDAAQDANQVEWEAHLSWPLLKRGGLLIIDDFLWREAKDREDRPELGVRRFMEAIDGEFSIVEAGSQLILRKIQK